MNEATVNSSTEQKWEAADLLAYTKNERCCFQVVSVEGRHFLTEMPRARLERITSEVYGVPGSANDDEVRERAEGLALEAVDKLLSVEWLADKVINMAIYVPGGDE